MFNCDRLPVCEEVWRQAKGRDTDPKRPFWTTIGIEPASE